MKKLMMLLFCFTLLLSALPVHSAAATKYFYDGKWHEYKAPPVFLQVNGEFVQGDMPPVIFDNSTLVPARAVFEKLGAKVTWDAKKMIVGVTLDDKNISMTINKKSAAVNGNAYDMLIPPKIVNDRTMIPVRFVAEAIGLKVEWMEAERIVKISRPDIGIDNVQVSVNSLNTRIAISSSSIIRDYSVQEFNNHPRVAVDIKNAVLEWKNGETEVQNSYVYKVRAAQNNDNPNITRVVADLSGWTGYVVSLSADRKQLYIDVDSSPAEIEGIKFTKSGNTDSLDIDMEYARRPEFAPANYKNKIILDIPMSSVKSLKKNIYAYGNYIRGIECSQFDSNTARLTISTTGMALFEAGDAEKGIRLTFSDPSGRNMLYTNREYPRLVLRNERIGLNYFNYKYRSEGNRFIISTPSSLTDSYLGRLMVNDSFMHNIDIIKNSTDSTTDIIFNAKALYGYNIDTVENNNEISVRALPHSDPRYPDRTYNRNIDSRIKEKIVVIDPGHGGSERGATYPDGAEENAQIKEKDLNLDISLKLYKMLKDAGINVYMTRKDDSSFDLYSRGDFANKLNASLLISVHNNAGNSWEHGSMALYNPTVYDKSYGISSERLAQIVQQEMLKNLETNDRGVWKRPNLAVLNNAKMPAVIAEVAYITNEPDRLRLMETSFRSKAAEALYNATLKALGEIVESEGSN